MEVTPLEQVWNGDSETLASIVAGKLESEGILMRVHGSMTPYRTSALALGGSWAILVPAGKAPRAREALVENDEGHNVVEPEDGAGLTSNQRATTSASRLCSGRRWPSGCSSRS